MNQEPERLEIPLPGGGSMAFRHLEPKEAFRMGARGVYYDEEPVHRIRLAEDFWMAETPVTQLQFALWTAVEQVRHENHFPNRLEHPAENMDWFQAIRFCDWLTAQVGPEDKPAGFYRFCLPTEAEWEYACRAGTESEHYSGDGEEAWTKAGWFGEEWGSGSTHPVGQKMPNAFGLFDLHGNVWEWCHDEWDAEVYRKHLDGGLDPSWELRALEWRAGLDRMLRTSQRRVLRGGSWIDTAWDCRSAFRGRRKPDDRNWNYGFRICLVRGPSASPGAGAGQPTREYLKGGN